MIAGQASDGFNGGEGVDLIAYWEPDEGTPGNDASEFTSIYADLADGTARDSLVVPEFTDRLTDVEGVLGTTGSDTLLGDSKNNTFFGNGGKDQINGRAGDDVLDGGRGEDTLIGGLGDDLLVGQAGSDSYDGGEGNDTIDLGYGGSFQITDYLAPDFRDLYEQENLNAEAVIGAEAVMAAPGSDGIIVSYFKPEGFNSGDVPAEDNETFRNVENLIRTDAEGFDETVQDTDLGEWRREDEIGILRYGDRLVGNDEANLIDGRAGDDILEGGGGNDTLIGGTGRDILIGGAGDDVLVASLATTPDARGGESGLFDELTGGGRK